MILLDINILLPAYRTEHPDHAGARSWLTQVLERSTNVCVADVSASGFVRIATNRRVFKESVPVEAAVEFVDRVIASGASVVTAGPRHWAIMRGLLIGARATGNLVSDAHLAAIAIENGASIATRDRDFSRFAGVEWFDPLEPGAE